MDVKGIAWVGNVYQKFENMCLEVEEVMYQDTVKYVEDQVQTVGASVKRLMQDLIPPSALDSENVFPFCLTVEQDSDDMIWQKPKTTKKNGPSKADSEELTRTFKVTSEIGDDLSVAPLINVRHDVDDTCTPGDFVNGACSGLRSRKRRGVGKSNISDLGVNDDRSEGRMTPFGTSCSISPPKKYLSKSSSLSCNFVNETCEASCDQMAKIPTASTDQYTRPVTITESSNDDESTSNFIPDLSNEAVLIDSIGNNDNDRGIMTSEAVSAGPSASDLYLNYKVVYTGQSSQNEEVRYDEYGDEEISVCYPNQSRKLFVWNPAMDIKTVFEDGAEMVQQNDESLLEETIVLVNDNDLQSLPQRECKTRTSTKKIRESLFSRMRSGRKQEYKQLVMQQGSSENPNNKHDEASKPKVSVVAEELRSCDSCESEWELL